MVAPTAPSTSRTHKNPAYTHSEPHTQTRYTTQSLSNKSAAELHPVMLNQRRCAAADLLSCVVPLANFSTVQCPESCLPQRAGMRSCLVKPISGFHHLASLSLSLSLSLPLLRLSFNLPSLPSSRLCSRLCADLSHANYFCLSARPPSLPCALPLSLCVSSLLMESLYLCLCEHATTPPYLLS